MGFINQWKDTAAQNKNKSVLSVNRHQNEPSIK